jgi:hypothetical protein
MAAEVLDLTLLQAGEKAIVDPQPVAAAQVATCPVTGSMRSKIALPVADSSRPPIRS